MNAITRITLALAAATLLAGAAHAEQFWVAYEGDVLPDQVGWTRQDSEQHLGKRADVYVQDGVLTIDSLEDINIYDYFVYEPSQPITLAPGEELVVQMRVRVPVVDSEFYYDQGLSIGVNENYLAVLGLANDYLYYSTADGTELRTEVVTSDWHVYEIRSYDLSMYEVYVDGGHVASSSFWPIGNKDESIVFGDFISGAGSLTQWDYVRFGVVPEPASMALFAVMISGLFRVRKPRKCN